MNERIKELAKEAGLDPDSYDRYGLFDEEKFAQLIIAECLEQIDKVRDGHEAKLEIKEALGADWAGLAVARHFGVE